ncbi:MAG: hypothetical protein U0401_00420 [Anaerolineae bacterium]
METVFPFFHWTNLLIVPGLLIGYTIHELGHALAAYFLGDTSQVERGKISLNPLKHISWLGFIAFLILGLGWPKPMQVNPLKFKRGYLDVCLAALSGPLASLTFGLAGLLLTLTIAAAVVYQSKVSTDTVLPYLFLDMAQLPAALNLQALAIALTSGLAKASLALAFISLLPLPGLDGFTVLVSFMAFWRQRRRPTPAPHPNPATRPLALLVEQQIRRNSVAEIHFRAGAQFHTGQQYEDAIARYQQAIRNDQYFGPAYVNLGLAYLAKGDRKKAIQSFKGATRYADDRKSQQEAWQQLQQLSQTPPLNETMVEVSKAQGVTPWTDTTPRPNWFNLGMTTVLMLVAAIGLYGYLLVQLVKLLKA